jgi:hypothetical protein
MRFVDRGKVYDTEKATLIHDTGIRSWSWPVCDGFGYARHLYYKQPDEKGYAYHFFKVTETWDVPGWIRWLFGAENKVTGKTGKAFVLFAHFSFDLQDQYLQNPDVAADIITSVGSIKIA